MISKKVYFWIILCVGIILLSLMIVPWLRQNLRQSSSPPPDLLSQPRIVSMAPSITEILFALDLGDYVVGVTQYCNYPSQALQKPKIGGYLTPNFEAILRLQPNWVLLLPEHHQLEPSFKKLNIPILRLDHRTIPSILESVLTIGNTFGVSQKAQYLVSNIQKRLNEIQQATRTLPRPKVLLTIGQNMGESSTYSIYVAGKRTYYDELIELAGGRNAYDGDLPFALLSTEGLIRLQPDIIVDLVPEASDQKVDVSQCLKRWEQISLLQAVQEKKVYIITDDYTTVPGIRFILLVEKIVKIIHPEIHLPEEDHHE